MSARIYCQPGLDGDLSGCAVIGPSVLAPAIAYYFAPKPVRATAQADLMAIHLLTAFNKATTGTVHHPSVDV
jgi:hypothetical protein